MKRQSILFITFSMFVFGVRVANANMMTFTFEGSVKSINDHGTGLLDSSVIVGTPLSGTYTFDSEAPDTQGLSYLAVYQQHISNGASFALTVGNYNLNVLDGYYDIQIENDGGSGYNDDKYSVESGVGTTIFTNGVDLFSAGFSLDLRDFNSGNVFSNTALPTSLDLSLFSDGGTILITYWDGLGGSVDIKADITSIVPVPGAVLLGVIGLSFAGWKLRKRKEL